MDEAQGEEPLAEECQSRNPHNETPKRQTRSPTMVGLLDLNESAGWNASSATNGRHEVGPGPYRHWASTIASSTRRDSFFEVFGSVAP